MKRRTFLATAASLPWLGRIGAAARSEPATAGEAFLRAWGDPDREFSPAPFWFWNDDLSREELSRQMADFRAHGVYAFVIHPRAGLPRSIGWMSERMLDFMRFAVEEAKRHGMWAILYDEGMYPSGSSSGQVVAENAAYRTRALFAVDLDEAKPGEVVRGIRIGADGEPALEAGQTLVAVVPRADGHRIAVVDRAVREGSSYIRGLHFTQDDPPRRADHREVPENHPPAADILNPEAVACFIRLVYQRFYDKLGSHFGETIRAIFTDEPSFLAKGGERGAVPGTTGILDHVNRLLAYDFAPHLPALWYGEEPEAARWRREWNRALQARLEETFYAPISRWCEAHGIALTGHPAQPDDIGHLRHFHIPGQDIVWRYIEPDRPSALEGSQSTTGKCASSAMIHLGRRRNGNEFVGAYGHNLTYEEMEWLTWWLVARGCNLLIPHAFYYSIRGPRIDERPPDVGPNSPWWDLYRPYADACRRLCWLNTDATHVCRVAILGRNDWLPWRAAKVCFQHQRDFNYIEARHLWEDARVDAEGIRLAGMHYRALIVEDEPPARAAEAMATLAGAGRVIRYESGMADSALVERMDRLAEPDVRAEPAAPDLRVRHVVKHGVHAYILFNEGRERLRLALTTQARGRRMLLDPACGQAEPVGADDPITLEPHALRVLVVQPPG